MPDNHRNRTYQSWSHMMTRCYNKHSRQYCHYGALGIKVAQAWHSYEQFLADMGKRPRGHGLARIHVSKDYSKDNCHWVPSDRSRRKDQAQINGQYIVDIADRLGITYSTAYHRYITRGKPIP